MVICETRFQAMQPRHSRVSAGRLVANVPGWKRLHSWASPIPVGPRALNVEDIANFLSLLAIGLVMVPRLGVFIGTAIPLILGWLRR